MVARGKERKRLREGESRRAEGARGTEGDRTRQDETERDRGGRETAGGGRFNQEGGRGGKKDSAYGKVTEEEEAVVCEPGERREINNCIINKRILYSIHSVHREY